MKTKSLVFLGIALSSLCSYGSYGQDAGAPDAYGQNVVQGADMQGTGQGKTEKCPQMAAENNAASGQDNAPGAADGCSGDSNTVESSGEDITMSLDSSCGYEYSRFIVKTVSTKPQPHYEKFSVNGDGSVGLKAAVQGEMLWLYVDAVDDKNLVAQGQIEKDGVIQVNCSTLPALP
jgi:hypothetical protein